MSEFDFEISVAELKQRMDAGEDLCVVDCREPHECEICKIDGTILMPMSEFGNRFQELDPEREILVHCRSGGRSGQVVKFLRAKGYLKARNVAGGILAWAREIDPTMPTY